MPEPMPYEEMMGSLRKQAGRLRETCDEWERFDVEQAIVDELKVERDAIEQAIRMLEEMHRD